MGSDPVLRNVEAPGDPDALVLLHIVQETPEAGHSCRMADQALMQADRHHLGLCRAFLVEDVESVLYQAEPLVRVDHAGGVLAVVVGQRIGHDQVRLALYGLPEGQLLAVIVAVVGEAAFLDKQAARIHARSIAAVPASRPLADRLLQRLDGLPDVLALLLFGELEVAHPAPAVAADVPAGGPDRLRSRQVSLQRQRAAEHGERHPALLEGAVDAPEAHAAAVLEHAFAGEIAALQSDRGSARLGEPRLGVALAILDRRLRAFLEVHDEVDGDARAAGPFRIGRIGAVADQVAFRFPAHDGLLTSSAPI